MSKLISACLFILIPWSNIEAQAGFGIKGGGDLASVNVDNSEAMVAYHVGGFWRIPFGSDMFVQPELLYSVKGSNLPDFFYSADLEFKMNYLSLPVMLGIKAGDRWIFSFGPEISKLLRGSFKVDDTESQGSDGYSQFDFGLDAGVDFAITTGLGVYLRYNYGLVDVLQVQFTDENGQSLGGFNKGKNRCLQAGISWVISGVE